MCVQVKGMPFRELSAHCDAGSLTECLKARRPDQTKAKGHGRQGGFTDDAYPLTPEGDPPCAIVGRDEPVSDGEREEAPSFG